MSCSLFRRFDARTFRCFVFLCLVWHPCDSFGTPPSVVDKKTHQLESKNDKRNVNEISIESACSVKI